MTATKAPKTATPKTSKAPKSTKSEPKTGLRKPQLRILQALAKSTKPLTRKEIADKSNCDIACLTSWIGSHDDSVRAKNDAKMMSLLTLKHVKFGQSDESTGVTYVITASGRAAVAKS